MKRSIMATTLLLVATATAAAKGSVPPEITKLIGDQIDAGGAEDEDEGVDGHYADGVKLVVTDMPHGSTPLIDPKDIDLGPGYRGHADKHVDVQLSRDGATAWASLETAVAVHQRTTDPDGVAGEFDDTIPYRISDVLVKGPSGWRIVASAWSQPYANAEVNAAAAKGNLTLTPLPVWGGEASLLVAFVKLVNDGFDRPATTRKALVVLGSGPGERTTSGPAFAKAWNATWAKHLVIDGTPLAGLAPSGTTGWVVANVKLAKTKGKKSYQIPFRLFLVFDQDDAGAWNLVHAHFATTT